MLAGCALNTESPVKTNGLDCSARVFNSFPPHLKMSVFALCIQQLQWQCQVFQLEIIRIYFNEYFNEYPYYCGQLTLWNLLDDRRHSSKSKQIGIWILVWAKKSLTISPFCLSIVPIQKGLPLHNCSLIQKENSHWLWIQLPTQGKEKLWEKGESLGPWQKQKLKNISPTIVVPNCKEVDESYLAAILLAANKIVMYMDNIMCYTCAYMCITLKLWSFILRVYPLSFCMNLCSGCTSW